MGETRDVSLVAAVNKAALRLYEHYFNPLESEGVVGPGEVLTCPDICVFFSVAYEHING